VGLSAGSPVYLMIRMMQADVCHILDPKGPPFALVHTTHSHIILIGAILKHVQM
jgi:hypothetical protein